ncbi:hypothetical protein [Dyadobacter sp. CY326]|uniref:hypothetical protein n=1 Tax=Dyadobacter sp. CY326 TaxID=2907300 RepID=UPI001F2EA175|nr:hypothetical protein [Dyadobacter sp. CY326]MCE7064884.1 hypothetical protein [Dyadobacter sp. CY326]
MQSAITSMSSEAFKQQFCNWLEAMHLQFAQVQNVGELATELAVFKDGTLLMNIMLITLADWQHVQAQMWQLTVDKAILLRERGTRCVIVWEDYWLKNPAIVQSRLNAMLGKSQKIPARLTQVRRIDQADAADFLQTNHLNGSVSAKSRYGLFLPKRYFRVIGNDFQFDDEADELLVAVATFSAPRVFQRVEGPFRSFEMVRFASLLHTNVSGGLDKLLTAFTREKNPDDLMTYADLEWSEGAGYAKLGFARISQTAPMTFILDLKNMTRHAKTADLDPNATISVQNAGSIKFVKTLAKHATDA